MRRATRAISFVPHACCYVTEKSWKLDYYVAIAANYDLLVYISYHIQKLGGIIRAVLLITTVFVVLGVHRPAHSAVTELTR